MMNSFIKGTADAYAMAIIFKRLLIKQDFNEFKYAMESIIKKLSKQLYSILVDDVLELMGIYVILAKYNKTLEIYTK